MAPIFASPDIAALVAAFPPPLPTKERPSLVKSHSGNNLLDSRKVLAKFRVLLETSASRVKKTDIASRLSIQDADWLFECYDGDLCYSKDVRAVVPQKETQALLEKLRSQAQTEFVDVADFASKENISRQSCDRLMARESNLRQFTAGEGRSFVAVQSLIDGMKGELLSEVGNADGERVDLTSNRSFILAEVLHELVEEALAQRGAQGRLFKDDGKIIYEPEDYQTSRDRKRQEQLQSSVQDALRSLATDGWCLVQDDTMTHNDREAQPAQDAQSVIEQVFAQYSRQDGFEELTALKQGTSGTASAQKVLAKTSSVEAAMNEMDRRVQELQRTSDTTISLEALQSTLCEQTSSPGLSKCLLRASEYRQILEETAKSVLGSIEAAKSERFVSICRGTLLCPLELYSQGLQTVSDENLKQRLDTYLCEHFRNEIVPCLVRDCTAASVLQDKTRSRDVDKLSTVSTQAKTVADFESAAGKLCRKQKIEAPNSDDLSTAKREALLSKLQSVKSMSRASDILQNLVWILLAQKSKGLFLSAGKDTSRMIKHYQSFSDSEEGRRLEQWRDGLKAGKQSDSDVQDMRTMAEQVIESMYGRADSQSDIERR